MLSIEFRKPNTLARTLTSWISTIALTLIGLTSPLTSRLIAELVNPIAYKGRLHDIFLSNPEEGGFWLILTCLPFIFVLLLSKLFKPVSGANYFAHTLGINCALFFLDALAIYINMPSKAYGGNFTPIVYPLYGVLTALVGWGLGVTLGQRLYVACHR